jgi:hypothetical protein
MREQMTVFANVMQIIRKEMMNMLFLSNKPALYLVSTVSENQL